ncbi:hypothetical protein [Wolbachia endosymbiont of Folsomia candida]|uniref:hypothetical protein n=1 Tax=Wolbachia endosymbiont of Folsomia candida TaxID=169402 RepID=UPI000A6C99A5|nr:hypothetical protein [Wolbachia endosymbiont of Folsomia candida]APR98114.1 hypothetical protein ASM33_02255 [Wolbachia endosymbiont of Folsomia candida]
MAGRDIRFKFHEDKYEKLCYEKFPQNSYYEKFSNDCHGFLFRAERDSQTFALKKDYLYLESNGTSKGIYGTTLMNQSEKLHPNFDGEVGVKGEWIFEIKIPKQDFDDVVSAARGFDYELL